MKYFRIEDSFESSDRWYLKGPETLEGDPIDPRSFTEGHRYNGVQPLRIQLRRGARPLNFTLGAFDMPVVDRELGKAIEAIAPGEVQLIPVKVAEDYGWFDILNALTLRGALNENLSEISRWTVEDGVPGKVGKYFGIAKLVLNRAEILNSQIFRLLDWPLPLIVSEKLKNLLERLDVSGITFTELESV